MVAVGFTPTADDLTYIRLLAGDTGTTPLLSDAELTTLCGHADTPRLAAASALDAIAASEVLVSKKITSQGLTTDGPAVATSLRTQAAALRQQEASEGYAVAFAVPPRHRIVPEGTEAPWFEVGPWVL